MSLVGFFCAVVCALPPGQITIDAIPADRGASLIHQNGVVIGRYIDDTYPGDPRLLAAEFRREHVGLILVGTYRQHTDFGPGAINVVEYYPVLDRSSRVGSLPYTGSPGVGYVLQAFSWGDNLYDGTLKRRCTHGDTLIACARRYAPPTAGQMKTMWCQAQWSRAPVVLWYYYSTANVAAILAIEHSECIRRPRR